MRSALGIAFIGLIAWWAPAAAGEYDIALVNVNGLSFQTSDPYPAEWLAMGEGLEAIGFVTAFGAMLTPHHRLATHEYTFRFWGLTVAERFFDPPTQVVIVGFANNARARFYEDPRGSGTSADFGEAPSSAVGTFTDGALWMGGDLDDFRLFYDFQYDEGGWAASLDIDEGLVSGNVNPCCGYSASGLLGRAAGSIPAGYDGRLQGCFRIQSSPGTGIAGDCAPVPASRSTWGAIKKTYR